MEFFKTLSGKRNRKKSERCMAGCGIRSGGNQYRDYDMLVIDEFMAAYRYGLIPNKEAVQFLKDRPDNLEVVLNRTGSVR